MMNSIDVGRMPTPSGQAGASPLSPEQLSGLTKVLGTYDSQNLSQSDAKEIVSQIKGLGITPGRSLATAMGGAGFDARDIGRKARVDQDGPPPPPPSEGIPDEPRGQTPGTINKEAIGALKLLIEGYAGNDITDDDWNDILTAMDDSGYDLSKTLLNVKL
jgi:hypothetical protein